MLLSAFASDAGALSRSGPMVPVEFAGLKVWHEPQPFAEKTAWPADALPPPPEDVVVPPAGVVVEFDEVERRAVRALADVGLVPQLRHRGGAREGSGGSRQTG